MTEKDKELIKQHLNDPELRKFQEWLGDTRNREMKENPDWQRAVHEALEHLGKFVDTDTNKNPTIRQDIEAIMADKAKEVDEGKEDKTEEVVGEEKTYDPGPGATAQNEDPRRAAKARGEDLDKKAADEQKARDAARKEAMEDEEADASGLPAAPTPPPGRYVPGPQSGGAGGAPGGPDAPGAPGPDAPGGANSDRSGATEGIDIDSGKGGRGGNNR